MRRISASISRILRHITLVWAMLASVQLASAGDATAQPPGPTDWQRAGLQAAMKDPLADVQIQAVRFCIEKKWLSEFQIPAAQWVGWLRDSNGQVRAYAADVLRDLQELGVPMPTEAQQALLVLIRNKDEDPWVRRMAVMALGSLGEKMPPEAPALLLSLCQDKDCDESLKAMAGQTLWRLGEKMPLEALQVLPGMLHSNLYHLLPNEPVAEAFWRAAQRMRLEVNQALLTLIQDTKADSNDRALAARTLRHRGPQMSAVEQRALLMLLMDKGADYYAGMSSAEALGHLGPQMRAEVWQALLAVLMDKRAHQNVRESAAQALGRLGAQMSSEVADALVAVISDTKTDQDVRREASRALAKAGENMSREVQQALLNLQKQGLDQYKTRLGSVESYAADVFSNMGEKIPAEALQGEVTLLQDIGANASARTAAAYVILRQGPKMPPEAKKALEAVVQDKNCDSRLRIAALGGLCGLEGPGHMPVEVQQMLLTLLQDKTEYPEVRRWAVSALGNLGQEMPDKVKQELLALLQHKGRPPFKLKPPFDLEMEVVYALAELNDKMPPEVQQILLAKLNFDKNHDDNERTWAAHILARLGPKTPPEAVRELLPLIKTKSYPNFTSGGAAESLAKMGDKVPPEAQQALLSMLREEDIDTLAVFHVLDGVGITEVSLPHMADVFSAPYENRRLRGSASWLRFHLYLWSGRHPRLLQTVRFVGHQTANPLLGDTPPHEVLGIISQLLPHTAKHPELRLELAQRAAQIVTTHVNTFPLDDPTRRVLQDLTQQYTRRVLQDLTQQYREDWNPDVEEALQRVRNPLTLDEKARRTR